MRTAKGASKDYAGYSLWLDQVRDELHPRASLGGDTDADVAIVGAGYTGLWTAYYLLEADPSLRVVILEKEIAGFGASGRNGGWCSALFAAPRNKIARRYGREAALRQQRAMFETVDEVGRVVRKEGIHADYVKGGTLTLVSSKTQIDRVRRMLRDDLEWGYGPADFRWLDPDAVRERVRPAGIWGARFTPHCARIHPARLVRGLATVVERMGGVIYERTEVTDMDRGRVDTAHGVVRADVLIHATEGYSATWGPRRRRLLPLYSLMLATEPLPSDVWDEIGWTGCETIHDGRHLLIYAQRTPDDRIAIGGRGAPYHFGSRVSDENDHHPGVHGSLERVLRSLFPQVADATITHRWGGCLGVPRDWFSSVGLDRASGIGWAGGYVGDGVSTSNLAGRTLRDLILGRESDLVGLPWVNHRSRSWEPEPFRWIGVNLGLRAMAHADRVEERTGRPNGRGDLIKRLIGL